MAQGQRRGEGRGGSLVVVQKAIDGGRLLVSPEMERMEMGQIH